MIKSLLTAWNDFHFISEDEHPALVLTHKVLDAMYTNNDVAITPANNAQYLKIVEDNKEKAYQQSPYGPEGNRNTDKEVYWFRTLFFHESEDNNKPKSA